MTKLQAEINPAAQNVDIKSCSIGKNRAIQGKTKINPSIIVKILLGFLDLITECIEDNIAAKAAIEKRPNVRYKLNWIIFIKF